MKKGFFQFDVYGLNRAGANKKAEIAFIAGTCVAFVLFLSGILLTSRRMFTHDTIWTYGLMHHFYGALSNGVFPFWDPYNYAGQPLYYNLGIARLFEPATLLLVTLNRIAGFSLLSLYHWDYVLRIIIAGIGVYLCYRQTNEFTVSNFAVFLAFIFSSFVFAAFRQCGLLTSFSWSGWAMWFFLRLRKELTVFNVVGCSLFVGLMITSYQAGYFLTFFSFFALSLFLNDRAWYAHLARDRRVLPLAALAAAIVVSLSMQAVAVYREKGNAEPVLRQMDSARRRGAYDDKAGGSPSYPKDFIGLVLPPLAAKGWMGPRVGAQSAFLSDQWLKPLSECPFYIGLLPFCFALLGLFFSRDTYRLNFLCLALLTALLALGAGLRLGPLSNLIFPFLRYARSMEIFQPFFIFSLLYFVGQGVDACVRWGLEHGE